MDGPCKSFTTGTVNGSSRSIRFLSSTAINESRPSRSRPARASSLFSGTRSTAHACARRNSSRRRWLATRHYENFHVVSFLLPKRLHQDFYNVYAFCRWADDLGDEIGDTHESLRLLTWWREQLRAMYAGEARHPVFVALSPTVVRHALPMQPFDHLIQAFEQDQRVAIYHDWDELMAYCRHSANPVGRLVLGLCGDSDPVRFQLSDATCTALQLANFWQDVIVDLEKARVYLPLSLLRKHGYTLDELHARRFTPAFKSAMRDAVEYARGLFHQGLPLSRMVDKRLALDLDLFSRGGLRILDKIERQGFDVLSRRPSITKSERVRILIGSLLRTAFTARAA